MLVHKSNMQGDSSQHENWCHNVVLVAVQSRDVELRSDPLSCSVQLNRAGRIWSEQPLGVFCVCKSNETACRMLSPCCCCA